MRQGQTKKHRLIKQEITETQTRHSDKSKQIQTQRPDRQTGKQTGRQDGLNTRDDRENTQRQDKDRLDMKGN